MTPLSRTYGAGGWKQNPRIWLPSEVKKAHTDTDHWIGKKNAERNFKKLPLIFSSWHKFEEVPWACGYTVNDFTHWVQFLLFLFFCFCFFLTLPLPLFFHNQPSKIIWKLFRFCVFVSTGMCPLLTVIQTTTLSGQDRCFPQQRHRTYSMYSVTVCGCLFLLVVLACPGPKSDQVPSYLNECFTLSKENKPLLT